MAADMDSAERAALYVVHLLTQVHPLDDMGLAETLRTAAALHGARLMLLGLRVGGGRAESLLASAEARAWARADVLTAPLAPVPADARG